MAVGFGGLSVYVVLFAIAVAISVYGPPACVARSMRYPISFFGLPHVVGSA